MGATTTLLLVLATTATLFFDLSAARCRVMMFNGGMVQGLHTSPVLGGAFEKNPADPGKVIIKYMTKTGGVVTGTTHHFFGMKGKWYDAAAKLNTKHGSSTAASDSKADGYYLAKDDNAAGSSVVANARWSTTPGDVLNLYFLSKAKASEVAWIMGYDVLAANNEPIYAYVNDGLLFRSGPLRYDAYNAVVDVQATNPAAKTLKIVCSKLDSAVGKAAITRLFVGKGNYQNALVALNAYFAATANQNGNTIATFKNDAGLKGAHENWIYVDVVGTNGNFANTVSKTSFDILADALIYVEDIAWMAAYDLVKGLVAHQVMYHVNDGFMNGELMPADVKKVVGTVVFGGPDDTSISIYDLKAGTPGNLNNVRIFYGLLAWDDAKAGLGGHSTATDGGSGNGAFFMAGNAGSDISGGGVAHVERALNTAGKHKASQVMWVAARQIGGAAAGTMAHRVMQMPKKT